MPWIFGSFLVTPCALTSCHVVISEQDSTIRAVGYNRCVTGRRLRDGNPTVRFRQSAEDRSRVRDTQPTRGVSDEIWEEEVLSLSICLSTRLSHTAETSTLSRIKCERYIFIKKCVRSFIEVRKLCLIMFPVIFIFVYGYTTLSDAFCDRLLVS